MKGINEAMKRLQEVRVNRKLNKGDQFKNPNGVIVTIIDVDEEHLLDGEPQVTYRFEDSKETKCYKQSSVNAMLDQNRYKAMINEKKLVENNYGLTNGSSDMLFTSICNTEVLDNLKNGVEYIRDYLDVIVEDPMLYQNETPNKLQAIYNNLQKAVNELDNYWSNI